MAKLLDGREIAKKIREDVKARADQLEKRPSLAIVLATADDSAKTYANTIKKTAEETGLIAELIDLGENTDQTELTEQVVKLANDGNINGIILQTPVANSIDLEEVRSLIPPEKDIDGANPLSAGRLYGGTAAFAPATAQAIIETLRYYEIPLSGKCAVVIGRSKVVGKPAAQLLLDRDATVIVCHSKTSDLAFYTKTADVLVAATGKAGLIGREHLNPSKKTVVIDVGTNFTEEGKMVGDVRFDEVEPLATAITPVPGGIGPITTSILLRNTLEAFESQNAKTP